MSRFARQVKRRDSEPEWTVELPREWKTAPWFRVKVLATGQLDDGGQALLVTALLKDGTNLFAVTWPGGQRLSRAAPYTGYAIEERFTGQPPVAGQDVIDRMWRVVVDQMAASSRWARQPAVEAQMERAALAISGGWIGSDELNALLADQGEDALTAELDRLGVPEAAA